MMIAMQALIVAAARTSNRMEAAQYDLRRDLAARRQLIDLVSCGEAREAANSDSNVSRRSYVQRKGDLQTPELLLSEANGSIIAASERCALPEVCEYDITAGACRAEGRP